MKADLLERSRTYLFSPLSVVRPHGRIATRLIRLADSEPGNRELSQKRALAPGHLRSINSLRHNDAGPLTRSFTALNGNV
jgi:hypothetical protein